MFMRYVENYIGIFIVPGFKFFSSIALSKNFFIETNVHCYFAMISPYRFMACRKSSEISCVVCYYYYYLLVSRDRFDDG